MSVIFRLSFTLGVLCSWTRGYSRGAPRATCLDSPGTSHVSGEPGPVTNVSLTPRHGFSPQPGPGPVRILLDQRSIAFTDYIRVTLRSERAFKGFLVTAVGSEGYRIGSWTIPYGDSSSQYIHCQGVQDTVTHTDHSSKRYVLSLQWKPPHGFTGNVTVLASVVVDYRTYWAGLTSEPITVTGPGVTESVRGSTEIVSLVLVTGERAREERREAEEVEYLYQEDNDVLESVVSTKVFVDFQKRSTENEDEPLENSSTVKTSLKAMPRTFETTSYRSVMLWPRKPDKTTTTPASVKRKDTTTTPSPEAVTTFDAWWRLPVTVGANTIQDRFFRPTFFVENAEDLRSGLETTTYRSVLMKPRPKPSTVKSKPIPTIESQRTIAADTNNYYYSQKEYDEKHDNIKIPVFINTVDRSDNVLSETDIGVIPYDTYNQDEEELIVSTQSNKFNRLKLNTNQNSQSTTQKYKVKSNNIPEINADLKDDDTEPYAKMESEYGSWENGATQTTNISVGLLAIFYYWLV